MISNTRTLSPSVVNEFRFGATKFFNNLAQELQYERNIHEEFGIGLFIPPPIGWGLPSFSITGFSGFGAGAAIPFTGDNSIFQFIDNVSWIQRQPFHEDGRRNPPRSLQHDRHAGNPRLVDHRPSVSLATASPTSCSAGCRERRAPVRSVKPFTGKPASPYFFQDTWRVRPSVTLDLGLRYEYTPAWLDLKGEQMNMWIPPGFGTPSQQGKPCFVRIGSGDPYEGVSTRFDPRICVTRDGRMGDRLVQSDKTNFAPRLGAAWSPNPKTDRQGRLRDLLRAGYDQPRVRHEPQYPGTDHQRRGRADVRSSRTPAARRTRAVFRCLRKCACRRRRCTPINTIGGRPISNSTWSMHKEK